MANFSRQPRDELIRRLREQGWSLRRIAAHPDVELSVGMVHAILHRDDEDPDDELDDDDGEDEPPEPAELPEDEDDETYERRYVAELISELHLEDRSPNRLTLRRLRYVSAELTAEQSRQVAAAFDAARRAANGPIPV